jgi:hypothetical protein
MKFSSSPRNEECIDPLRPPRNRELEIHMDGYRVYQELATGFLPMPQIHPFSRFSPTWTSE